MEKNAKIYIAGHTGLVGSAIIKALESRGYSNLLVRDFKELDLINQMAVEKFFQEEKPEYVILAAAKVGGIIANSTYRGQFIYENLMIQNNVIHQSYVHGVKKLLFLGSTCIYPKMAPQPMKEEYLLTGPLEDTNEPYAIAKIAGLKMCESYNRQYGTRYISVMPTNLYGPNDNFDLEKSHVLPALLRKIHLGKCLENNDWNALRNDLNSLPIGKINGDNSKQDILKVLKEYGITITSQSSNPISVSVEIWGSGTPLREFMYSEDMAEACVYIINSENTSALIKKNPSNALINIGTGEEISIKDLAEKIKKTVDYKGEFSFNKDKPDGTPRKLTTVTRLHSLGYKHLTNLDEGLKLMYKSYLRTSKAEL